MARRLVLVALLMALVMAALPTVAPQPNASFAAEDGGASAGFAPSEETDDVCAGVPRNTLLASCTSCDRGAACIAYDQDARAPKLTGCDFSTGSPDAVCRNAGGRARTCEFQCFRRLADESAFEFVVPYKAPLSSPTTRAPEPPPPLTVPTTPDAPYESNVFVKAIGRLELSPKVTKVSIYGGRDGVLATKGRVVDMSVDAAAFAAAPQLASIALLNMDLSASGALTSALASAPGGLTSLSLRNDKLKAIPDDVLSRFEQLTTLSLQANALASVDLALPQLNALDLRDNQLTSFSALTPQLRSLDLSGNSFTAIPRSVFSLPNLRILNLGKNPIAEPLMLTPAQLAFLQNLEALTIETTATAPPTTTIPPPNDSVNGSTTTTTTLAGVTVVVSPLGSTTNDTAISEGDDSTASGSGSVGSSGGSTVGGGADARTPMTAVPSSVPSPQRNSTTSDIATNNKKDAGGSSTLLVVLLVVGAVVLMIASAFFLLWRKRRKAAKYNAALYFGHDSYTKMGSDGNDNQSSAASRSVITTGELPPWADGELLSYRLRAEDVKDARVVGSGSAAVVWLVSYRGGAHQLASKRLIDNGQLTLDRMAALVTEIKLAASLSHPSVVQFFGVAWTNETDLQALFEYMPNGDLRAYLDKTAPSPADWMPDKLRLALDVVEALVYTHSFDPPLVHRDLKSRNVLLSEDFKAKLSDFGCARSASESDTMTSDGVGTGRWLAPEVLSGSTSYDASSDMYSFGVLLTELDTHLVPYADVVAPDGSGVASEAAILQRVAQGELQPSMSAACPLAVRKIARACLSFHASHRPTAIQVAYSLRQAIRPSST